MQMRLKRSLSDSRAVWNKTTYGDTLRLGDSCSKISKMNRRIAAIAYLCDEQVSAAVRHFCFFAGAGKQI